MMSLTLMDEYQNPFWCVSTPVCMALNSKEPSNDYEGQHFLIKYQDAEGKVNQPHMTHTSEDRLPLSRAELGLLVFLDHVIGNIVYVLYIFTFYIITHNL